MDVSLGIACAVALVAGACDAMSGKIPNWLSYPVIVIGLAAPLLGWAQGGWTSGALGLLIGATPFLLAFIFGGAGGGDVKLMAGLGALVGFPLALDLVILSLLVGGTFLLIVRVWNLDFRQASLQLRSFLLMLPVGIRPAIATVHAGESVTRRRIRFAPAAAIATLWCAMGPLLRPPLGL